MLVFINSPKSLLITAALSIITIGCTGSRVELKRAAGTPSTVYVPVQAQAQVAVEKNLTPEEASTLVLNSERIEEATDQIRKRVPSDFRWNRFWNLLQNAHLALKEKISRQDFSPVFLLHGHSQRPEDFQAFADFVLSLGQGFEFLADNRRTSSAALGPLLTERIVEALYQMISSLKTDEKKTTHLRWISNLLFTEIQKEPSQNWRSIFQKLPHQLWEDLLTYLSNIKENEKLVFLYEQNKRHGNASWYGVLFAERLTENWESLYFTVQRIGLSNTLDLLLQIRVDQIAVIKQTDAQELLEQLTKAFEEQTYNGDLSFQFSQSWLDLIRLRNLERTLEQFIPRTYALNWLRRVHYVLEHKLRQDEILAAQFIRNLSDRSLDAVWLKVHFRQALLDHLNVNDLTIHGSLDEILKSRLAIHLEKDSHLRRKNILAFCETLKRMKVAEMKEITELEKIPQALQTPACILLPYDFWKDKSPVVMRVEKLEIHRDAVLFAPGIDLQIDAKSFSGGVIDTTATHKPADLAAEPTPSNYDALLIPVTIGIEAQAFENIPHAIHFFTFHLPIRKAKNGPPPVAKPAAGFAGGKVSISVTDPKTSIAPIIVSLGGLGQKGVPPRKGGRPSTSVISVGRIRDAINYISEKQLEMTIGVGRRLVHINPNVRKLALVFENAVKRENGEVKFFISERYLDALEQTDREKISTLCNSFESIQGCLNRFIGPEAVEALQQSYKSFENPKREYAKTPPLLVISNLSRDEASLPEGFPDNTAQTCGPEGPISDPELKGFFERSSR